MRKQVLASVIGILLVLSVFSVLVWQIKPVEATTTTFGRTTDMLVYQQADNAYGEEFTCPYAGTLLNITAYMAVLTAGSNVTAAILTTSNVLVAECIPYAASPFALAWVTFNFTSPPSVSATSYRLFLWANNTNTYFRVNETSNGLQHFWQGTTATYDNWGGLAFTQGIKINYSLSVYATLNYTVASPTQWTDGLPSADVYVVRNDTAGNYITVNGSATTQVLETNTNPVTALNNVLNSSQYWLPTNGKLVTNGTWTDYNGTVAPSRGNFTWEAWKTKVTQTSSSASLLYGVNILYSFVTINNFTYTGRNSTVEIGIRISAGATYATIENCTVIKCYGATVYSAIFVNGGSGHSIRFNNVSFNFQATQIDFEAVSNAVISNNTVDCDGNGQGIGEFGYSAAYQQNVNITSNTIKNWGQNPDLGMSMLWHGAYQTGTAYSYIYNNTFSNSFASCGGALVTKSAYDTIYNNTFSGQTIDWACGMFQQGGGGANWWLSPNGTRFFNNTISNYNYGGVLLITNSGGGTAYSMGNITIANNTFTNCDTGIMVGSATTLIYPENMTFIGNSFTTGTYGVRMGYNSASEYVTKDISILNNTFSTFTFGIRIYVGAVTPSTQYNTFGSCTYPVYDDSTTSTYRFNVGLTGYYMLNVSSVGAGYTSPSGDGWQYVSGTSVSVSWTPNSGHTRQDFAIDNVNQTSTTSPISITMSANHNGTAYFSGSPPPIILTVTSPTNTTYPYSTVSVELSASGGTVDKIIWNCTYTSGTVVYANQTYTVATSMTLLTGSYIFHAVANNTDGNIDALTVWFSVSLSGGSNQLIVNVWWSGWW